MRDEHNERTVIEKIDPLVGSVLDKRYRIDFRIAAGGFGAIYRATHVKSGHQVALKVLHRELATSDPRVIARFHREGATLAQLRDPHTITAYELGEDPDGPLYIVMELLHGESLFELFRARGPLPWQRMVAIARMVCSSLAEAHALGIVHRDLKPANINLETRDGHPDFVKVLDFGIAKIVRESEADNMELTQAGQMIGTFDYMAPEQMVGGQCTSRTDIYTLGVVMYEMISGRRPFADATSPTAMLASLLTLSPSPLSTFVDVPAELDRILLRCLEREPQNRYDVEELARELESLLAADEGATRQIKTPAPVVHDEVTVIDSRRGAPAAAGKREKRESSPHPNVIAHKGAEPRARRETPQTPSPNIIRREGSSPTSPVEPRARRDSSVPNANVVRRDGSQPPFDPRALQAAAGEPMRHEGAAPVTVLHQDGSSPHPRPVLNPSQPDVHPAYVPPAYAQPYAQHPPYLQPQPPGVALGSQPMLDPNAWNQPPMPYPAPVRGTGFDAGYDMSGAHNRELVVRRVVWTVAIVLGLILAIIVASRL
jgi:serine/threonine-protein kinase